MLSWRGDFCKLEGRATVEGQLAAEATLMCKMVDREPQPAKKPRRNERGDIHVHAVVAPGAKLGSGVQIGAYAVVGEDVELGDGCILHPHAVGAGTCKVRSWQCVSSVLLDRRRSTGLGISRRANRPAGRRRKYIPRIRDREPRHSKRRRDHYRRQQESVSRVFPRWTRLPRRRQHALCKQRDVGRSRSHRGLRHDRLRIPGTPILPRRPLRVRRRLHRNHAGRAAVLSRSLPIAKLPASA